MPYHLTIADKPAYLHARVTGTHSAENIRRFLEEVHETSVRLNHSAVLLEMNLSGLSLAATRIFDIITERSRYALRFERIAYVDVSAEREPEKMRFAETVAINRGVRVRLFRSLEDAERWISGSDGESGGP
jgi:hypothetical protein